MTLPRDRDAPPIAVFAAFAASLRDGALPPGVTAPAPDEAARRFAVYRNNVAYSLARALAARFPAVEGLLGAQAFAIHDRIFSETCRPGSPLLIHWGERFPDYLAGRPELAGRPCLPDVARIDWLRGRAYHAADREPAPPKAFEAAADDPGTPLLALHPSVSLVRSSYPALTLWEGSRSGAGAGEAVDGPEAALVLRDRLFDVQVWRLSEGDAAFVEALLAGGSLLAAAAAAARAEPVHQPAALLLRLQAAGALVVREDLP